MLAKEGAMEGNAEVGIGAGVSCIMTESPADIYSQSSPMADHWTAQQFLF